MESPSTPSFRCVPFDIDEAPSVLPLPRPPNGATPPGIIGLTHAPRTQVRPEVHVTPRQPTSTQAPDTQAWPIGHAVIPHDSGWQAPATQTRPVGQLTPTQVRSVHVMPTQTCAAAQVESVHVGGKH